MNKLICVIAFAFCLCTMMTGTSIAQSSSASKYDFGKIVRPEAQVGAGFSIDENSRIGKQVPINEYAGSIFFRLGSPVGLLEIGTNVAQYHCTAFLITRNLIMTNHHCGPGLLQQRAPRRDGAKEIIAMQFALGFLQEGIEDNVSRFRVEPKSLDSNRELDYAIFKVTTVPANFGVVRLATAEPRPRAPLFIIGHPGVVPQYISRNECAAARPAVSGSRLLHTCETWQGNSGSPVFDVETKRAIALHHSGSTAGKINFATPFYRIAEKSAVLRKALAEQAKIDGLAELTPPRSDPNAKPVHDPALVATVMQLQLMRLGCYRGRIDGDWGPGSTRALDQLIRQQGSIELAKPLVSVRNSNLLREIEKPVCRSVRETRPSSGTTSSQSQSTKKSARVTPTPSRGGTSKCIQRAQRYCSNPDNSSAIGYAACLTQAKAGCRS